MITNYSKNEKIALATITIFNFLLIKNCLPSTIYVLSIIVTSIYFFPVKVILKRKSDNLFLKITSSFIISVVLVLSYVSYLLDFNNEVLSIVLSIIGFFNFLLIIKLVQVNDEDKYLHLILVILIGQSIFS